MFAVVGVAVMYVVSKINYQTFRWMSVPALIFSIILLLLVFTPLGRSHNGARRWLYLGVEFQPSEIAKIAVILFFAARLCKRDSRKPLRYKNRTFTGRMLNRLEHIGFLELVPYIAVLGTVLLLVLLERHMSGTILVMVGAAAVLFAAGINIWWFIGGGAAVGSLLAFIMLATPYMNARIDLWLDPWGQRQGMATRRCSPCWPWGRAVCWAWGWATANRRCSISPNRKTTSFSPSWWRNWAISGGPW